MVWYEVPTMLNLVCSFYLGAALGDTDCWDVCSPYNGTVSQTTHGRSCQMWSHQSPHLHNFVNDSYYPDGSAEAAENFCRDPTETFKPWCYTMDPSIIWEYCNVTLCNSTKTSTKLKCDTKRCLIDRSGCPRLDPCLEPKDTNCTQTSGSLMVAVGIIIGVIVLFSLIAIAWFVVAGIVSKRDSEATGEIEVTDEPSGATDPDMKKDIHTCTDSPPPSYSDATRPKLTAKEMKCIKEQKLRDTYLKEMF